MNEDTSPIRSTSLTMEQNVVKCNMTFDQVLQEASDWLDTFPTTTRGERYAQNYIAFNSRRGIGNKRIGDVVLYRGANEFDCCLVIAKGGDRYGIVTQHNFSDYGFKLSGGPKV